MALQHLIQIYTRDGGGELVPGRRIPAASAADALSSARAMVPTVAAVAVVAVTLDDKNTVWTVEVLETIGDLPDGFEITLADELVSSSER